MHEIDELQQRFASFEPAISETLAGDVLRDVDAALMSRRFNARVHCTKKSRCRFTLLGIVLGTSLGLLIGVTLTWAWFGSAGPQIVYLESPRELPDELPAELPAGQPVETPKPERPVRERNDAATYDNSLIARLELPMEIDRLIDVTIEQRRQLKFPEGLGYYTAQNYVSPAAALPDRNMLLLQRELLEAFQ